MSIIFSRQCEYALQAVLYLALVNNGDRVSIRELSKRLKIPYHFLAKILQDLTHGGLLESSRGPAGGFALHRPADVINLYDIIEAIDGDALTHGCVLGFPECSSEKPCALHAQWSDARAGILRMLKEKSVAEMAGRMKKTAYRRGR